MKRGDFVTVVSGKGTVFLDETREYQILDTAVHPLEIKGAKPKPGSMEAPTQPTEMVRVDIGVVGDTNWGKKWYESSRFVFSREGSLPEA